MASFRKKTVKGRKQRLAADTGMSPAAIKRILNRKDRSKGDYRRDMLMDRLCGML